MSILIKNGVLLTLDSKGSLIDKGYLVIESDRIQSIGAGKPPEEVVESASTIIDASNMIVMPGIINAHTHLFQTFTRGLADNKSLLVWLRDCIWPIGEEMGVYEAKLAALLGCVENIRSGVTSIIDNQYIHSTPGIDNAFCQAAVDTGVRYLMARGWTDTNFLPPSYNETPEEIVERVEELVNQWNCHPSGRIRVEFGPQAIASCSETAFIKTVEKAQELGIGIHLHVAESQSQAERNFISNGMREIEWLHHLGCLNASVRLAHAIWLSNHEIDLISNCGAMVVHCPVSNMYLADGVAKIPEMLEAGITVALATDGPGSNNHQDMFETMKTASLLHKITQMNANSLLPDEVLKMACIGGAKAFGKGDEIGTIEIGKKADVILVDLNSPFVTPIHNYSSTLIYNGCGRAVDTVIINGKIVMQDKKITVLNEIELLQECREACVNLMARVKS